MVLIQIFGVNFLRTRLEGSSDDCVMLSVVSGW